MFYNGKILHLTSTLKLLHITIRKVLHLISLLYQNHIYYIRNIIYYILYLTSKSYTGNNYISYLHSNLIYCIYTRTACILNPK